MDAQFFSDDALPATLAPLAGWPVPDPAAQRLSCRLVRHICKEMARHAGALNFARFMDLALYAPGLGYYSAGLSKFGAAGDYVTAPEISPLFSRCVARCCSTVLSGLGGGDILELGAGSGVMAVEILMELARLEQLPARYLILESSADLRERQRTLLGSRVPEYVSRVQWLDRPPEPGFQGVIVANEVIDALPVRRFQWDDNSIADIKVIWRDEGFHWQPVRLQSGRLYDAVHDLTQKIKLENGYRSEINIDLESWLAAVAGPLRRGLILFIDYGYPRAEYYHPQRNSGTVLCHYRHRAHGNPLILPGLQDITAHVDFTAVERAAHKLGLELMGFTSQAQFLFDAGLPEMFTSQEAIPDAHYFDLARQIKILTLPGEMGEQFKCMALGRGVDELPAGFRSHDLRRVL